MLVLVSWGPEEAVGMALTSPPLTLLSTTHLKGMSGVASVTAGISESGLPVARHCATAASATSHTHTRTRAHKRTTTKKKT